MHWFRQCTRPIHSAYKRKPQPNTRTVARRTSSVRRQSAARGSHFPKQPPLAASLPAKEAGAQIEHRTIHLLTGSSNDECKHPCNLKPLSPFVPANDRDITPNQQTGRDCLAAHDCCTAQNSWTTTAIVSEPSPRPPLVLPHEFYSGHAPTLRLFTAVLLLPHDGPSHAPDCHARRPQWFLR